MNSPLQFLRTLACWGLIASLCVIFLSTAQGAEAIAPPTSYIDKGACPGKCCKYGKWTATKEFTVYDKEKPLLKLAVVKPGASFTGVYGEVRSLPFEVKLQADDEKVKQGETVYLLTDQGEGFFKAWYKGQIVQVNEASTDKFSREKSKKRESVWWVQVRLEDGRVGWMKADGQFDPTNCHDG